MAELIALPGWAGMIRMLENDVTLAPHDRVKCSLMEFLALRLNLPVQNDRSEGRPAPAVED